jgi:hypothetical protein
MGEMSPNLVTLLSTFSCNKEIPRGCHLRRLKIAIALIPNEVKQRGQKQGDRTGRIFVE